MPIQTKLLARHAALLLVVLLGGARILQAASSDSARTPEDPGICKFYCEDTCQSPGMIQAWCEMNDPNCQQADICPAPGGLWCNIPPQKMHRCKAGPA
jgi:hypothetical protein